jgi:hypothetical protein
MSDNCIQFVGDNVIPCENIYFPNFDNPNEFNNEQFSSFVQQKYNSPSYKFEDNYLEESSKPSEGFQLRQQQKFVAKYVNKHNDLGGCLIYHGLGSGKCHAYNTEILLDSGETILVQDIVVGDLLMGDRHIPQKVLSLGRGTDRMYEVRTATGENFTCNSEHILCLKTVSLLLPHKGVIEMTINQYNTLSLEDKKDLRLYRNPMQFKSSGDPPNNGAYLGGDLHREIKVSTLASRHAFVENLKSTNPLLEFTQSPTGLRWLINSMGIQCVVTANKMNTKWVVTITDSPLIPFTVTYKNIDNFYGFTLSGNHRYRLGNFVVTHNTCTSILVGEAFKAYKNQQELGSLKGIDDRIIVALPPAVREQFMEELKGKITEDQKRTGCITGITYNGDVISYEKDEVRSDLSNLEAVVSINTNKKQTNKTTGQLNRTTRSVKGLTYKKSNVDVNINKYWNIITHIGLINKLVLQKDANTIQPLAKQLQRGGSLMIIDEIQNLVSESGILYEKLLNVIKIFSRNNRVVVLSATPIYDKPFEIGLTLNILNPRVYFPTTKREFDALFMDEDTNTMKNKDLFYWMCNGYVSYFSGGNPRSFPFKRVIEKHYPMGSDQYNLYIKVLLNEAKMIDLDSENNKGENKNYLSRVRQYSNIVFPDEKDNKPKTKLESLRTLSTTTNNDSFLQTLSLKYSPKLAEIAKMICDNKGTHMVFSDLRVYGVEALGVILDRLGFTHLTPKLLKSKILNVFCKNPDNTKYYTIWSGEIKAGDREEYSSKIRMIYNHKDNIDGRLLKAVLGTTSIMEGVSFRNVRNVHIMNPWWNESRIQQVIARAIRYKSHEGLPEEDRFVNVYKHYTIFKGYPYSEYRAVKDEATDTKGQFQNSTMKGKIANVSSRGFFTVTVDQHMGNRAFEKKKQSVEFERVLKSSAVDCQHNKNANLVRLEEYITPYYDTKKTKEDKEEEQLYRIYYINPSSNMVFIRCQNKKPIYLISENEYNVLLTKKTYDSEVFSKTDITFVEAVVDHPQIRKKTVSNEDGTIKSVFTYKVKEDNPMVISTTGLNKTTTDFIINEDIDCSNNNGYLPGTNKTKQFQKVLESSNRYKKLGNLFSDVLYPGNTMEPKKEILTCISGKIINGTDTKLNDKLVKWLNQKIEETDEKKGRNKIIGDIIANDIRDYDSNLMNKFIFNPEDITEAMLTGIETSLNFQAGETTLNQFLEVVENAKDFYDVLKDIGMTQLKILLKECKKKVGDKR